MSEAQQLSALIATIYDTTFDLSKWMDALEQTTTFVGGQCAALALHDTASATGNLTYSWGDDPELTERYYSTLARINPVMVPTHLYYEPGDVFSLTQIMPVEEFHQTRIYREWVKPQGWGDFTHSMIEKSGSRFSHFGVAHAHADSPANDEHRRRLRLLVPHVMRAIAISKAIELHKIEADTLSAAVDSLTAGVFLVGADATIMYANTSGQAMLADGGVLRKVNDMLTAVQSPGKEGLRSAIAGSAAGDAVRNDEPVAIPLGAQNGDRWVANVVSLASGSRRQTGKLFGAEASVFVHKAELRRPTLIQTVVKHFKLTQAESRVLFAILEAGGVPQTAAALGLSEETVKTHLKRVFQKTGQSRQADLVKLVAGFANPMVG